MSFLRRVAGLSLRDMVRSSDIRRELGVEPLLLHVERSQLRLFRHLIGMPSRAPVLRGFPGTSDWEETPRQTQNPLEGLYISSGLGTPRDPPGGAREGCWGEGSLGALLSLLRPRPGPRLAEENGWMDYLFNYFCCALIKVFVILSIILHYATFFYSGQTGSGKTFTMLGENLFFIFLFIVKI